MRKALRPAAALLALIAGPSLIFASGGFAGTQAARPVQVRAAAAPETPATLATLSSTIQARTSFQQALNAQADAQRFYAAEASYSRSGPRYATASRSYVRAVPAYIPRPTAPFVDAPPSGGCMRHGRKSWDEMVSCWNYLVVQYSDWSAVRVFTIMQCESGGDPWAANPSGAHGLMQDMGGPFDPAANIAVAHGKYVASGHTFAQWTCRG